MENKIGFKIICLNCGNEIVLKEKSNSIPTMKEIEIGQAQNSAYIACCNCGNEIYFTWDW